MSVVMSVVMLCRHLAAERRQAAAFSLDELPEGASQQPEVGRLGALLHLHRLLQ